MAFWLEFKEFMENSDSLVRCSKPRPSSYMGHPLGRRGFHLSSAATTWNSELNSYGGEIRAELVLNHRHAKEFFSILEKQKEVIEGRIGSDLVWNNPDNTQKCKIYARKEIDITNQGLWPECRSWIKDKLETFHKVFSPIVKQLDVSDNQEE